MKKMLLVFFLLPCLACALPYYEEIDINGSDKSYVVIFYGNIFPEEEPEVRMLQRKYLEAADGKNFDNRTLRGGFEKQLNSYGIEVEVIQKKIE